MNAICQAVAEAVLHGHANRIYNILEISEALEGKRHARIRFDFEDSTQIVEVFILEDNLETEHYDVWRFIRSNFARKVLRNVAVLAEDDATEFQLISHATLAAECCTVNIFGVSSDETFEGLENSNMLGS